MSVRRRTWTNADGSRGEAWICNYTDAGGKRRLRTFDRKKEAEAFAGAVGVDVRRGIHVPDSQSVTVAEAARLWLEGAANLERTTLVQYETHVNLHIVPLIGAVKLSQLTVPMVRGFEDKLAATRSPAMVRNTPEWGANCITANRCSAPRLIVVMRSFARRWASRWARYSMAKHRPGCRTCGSPSRRLWRSNTRSANCGHHGASSRPR